MLSNLRYLKIFCSGDLSSVWGLSEFLFANPRLEHLSLDVGEARCVDLSESHPQSTLPFLRTLCIRVRVAYDWFQTLLETIDAPAVESLCLSCQDDGFEPLVDFFCTGRVNGSLCPRLSTTEPAPSRPGCGPLFPTLRHLHLDGINMSKGSWEQLLKAYSMITEITPDWDALTALTKSKVALPNLSHIRHSTGLPRLHLAEFLRKNVQSSPIRLSIARRGMPEQMDRKRDNLTRILHGLVDRVEVYDEEDGFAIEPDSMF